MKRQIYVMNKRKKWHLDDTSFEEVDIRGNIDTTTVRTTSWRWLKKHKASGNNIITIHQDYNFYYY